MIPKEIVDGIKWSTHREVIKGVVDVYVWKNFDIVYSSHGEYQMNNVDSVEKAEIKKAEEFIKKYL